MAGGGGRNTFLKWDNKCDRHERIEHTLIHREALYLCTLGNEQEIEKERESCISAYE